MKAFFAETLGILAASPLFRKLAVDLFGATDFELLLADEAVEEFDDQLERESLFCVISGSFNVFYE